MSTQDLHKAIVATYGLPEDSMFCGPSPIQGYIAISIPLSAQVMRRLADAMDPQVKPEGATSNGAVWLKSSETSATQRHVALEWRLGNDEHEHLIPWYALSAEQCKEQMVKHEVKP